VRILLLMVVSIFRQFFLVGQAIAVFCVTGHEAVWPVVYARLVASLLVELCELEHLRPIL
jgi:hypothetical protein